MQWSPGDYDKKVAVGPADRRRPGRLRVRQRPVRRHDPGKQVVDLGDILGDAKSDFTPALVERMTYQGKLYAVPQVTDMQLLVYRKSMLQKAGVQPPTDRRRADRRRARR